MSMDITFKGVTSLIFEIYQVWVLSITLVKRVEVEHFICEITHKPDSLRFWVKMWCQSHLNSCSIINVLFQSNETSPPGLTWYQEHGSILLEPHVTSAAWVPRSVWMCLLILLLLVFYGKFCNKKYFVDNSDIGGIKEVFLLYVRLTTLN
jgi:hypothetical protein